ncbi:AmmeMemoRadiSam system protein B [Roseobacter sp. YSTF-M11]|uniref:AmmeMemoRadiSam system protein B n=1 Tax=Roseobacter insulae TaxID=2859783 RepID=A0A9X1FTB3_9RHOB|nr:AmmeMemoRadiSam system protein B [Roseobacter insulae]MBW4707257.1 AmmeMemoRadiSam system protein B [Roseobacter insulae]
MVDAGARRLDAAGQTLPAPVMIRAARAALRRIPLLIGLISAGVSACFAGPDRAQFLEPVYDRQLIEAAIMAARPDAPSPPGVTGLIVPHHLLAADLMARGFWAASAGTYTRIILIGPDHFGLLDDGFATTEATLDTVFGPLTADREGVASLRAADASVAVQDVYADHSLTAVTPFITRFFPEAHVVPVLAALGTGPRDWRQIADALAPLVHDQTLIIQSTDFSHFLSQGEAALHDLESLAVLTAGGPDDIAELHQPHHLDSRAALAVQLDLQRRLGARPTVLANRNSATFGGSKAETTSYIVAAFHADPQATAQLRWPDHETIYFGGDLFLGRFMRPLLLDPELRPALTAPITRITDGAPLIANLEGAIFDSWVEELPARAHLMQQPLADPVLRALDLAALGLANNHAHDLGQAGYDTTLATLRDLGITPLEHAKLTSVGPLNIMALNFVPPNQMGGLKVPADSDPASLCTVPGQAPLVLFVHWGAEFTNEPDLVTQRIASELRSCGAALIVGAHSHKASTNIRFDGGPGALVYSLGNLLFDQTQEMGATSALLEVRVFEQGTLASRLIPLPNIYQDVLDLAGQGPSQ